MKEQKVFMWFATGSYGDEPWSGPHYFKDINKIGKKSYHTLDDLLKMDITDAKKKRLINAKVGTRITLHYLHANGNLCLKRLSNEQIKDIERLSNLKKKKNDAEDKFTQLKAQYENLSSKLLKSKK